MCQTHDIVLGLVGSRPRWLVREVSLTLTLNLNTTMNVELVYRTQLRVVGWTSENPECCAEKIPKSNLKIPKTG